MKVWLYYRLSRDEDDELNSLTNQRKIIYEYAVTNGHEVVGESFDDNVSGMHFNREGIDKIYEVVEAGKIEAIIVKDLSRLGRHRTQTALFIDYLREHDVRVLSATENIDTFNENDDLIIGFKGLVNDFYARDGSRRVRTGYHQQWPAQNSRGAGGTVQDRHAHFSSGAGTGRPARRRGKAPCPAAGAQRKIRRKALHPCEAENAVRSRHQICEERPETERGKGAVT